MTVYNSIVAYPIDNEEGFIYLEVDEVKSSSSDGIILAEAGDHIHKMSSKFSQALSPIRQIGNDVIKQMQELIQSPDEITIEFGLKLNFEAGAIITKASTEGNIKVSIKWKKTT